MKKLLLLFFICPLFVLSQVQVGTDLEGAAAGDNSGHSVSISSTGNVIAIGAYSNDTNGANSGHVRVYENLSGTWTQIGNDLVGETMGDNFGYSVSINSDGSIVAIGAISNDGNGADSGHVRVYENLSGTWTQIGNDIDGEAAGDNFGYSVSINSNGNIVSVGGISNDGNGANSGHVRVYENLSGTWTQIGNDIDGEAAGDLFGYSVSINSDGDIVAIGARDNDGTAADAGHVRVYKNLSGTWTQIGNDMDGEAAGDNFGNSVSINSDGNVLAIGGWRNDDFANSAGHVRVYENQSGVWTQIGNDIDGEAGGDRSGTSVGINSNGNIVAIGAYFNDGNNGALNSSGHVRVYENQSGVWVQIGTDIDGKFAGDRLGNSVSISSDGSVIIAGAPRNDNVGPDSGLSSVYDLSLVLSNSINENNSFSYYPNPVINNLNIILNQGLKLNQINLYNPLGQYLFSTKKLQININNLKSGIYFIEMETDKGRFIKKVIIR